ncbi:MAG: hypothetical protein UF351_00430 [Christensenellales bacterium]|nr:hypothetical protein [Christensenellales bacterium]
MVPSVVVERQLSNVMGGTGGLVGGTVSVASSQQQLQQLLATMA